MEFTASQQSSAFEDAQIRSLSESVLATVPLVAAVSLALRPEGETKGRCFAFPFRGSRDVLSALQILRC